MKEIRPGNVLVLPVRSLYPFWDIMSILQEFSLSHSVPECWAGMTLTPDSRGRHFPTPGQLEHGIPSTLQSFHIKDEPATQVGSIPLYRVKISVADGKERQLFCWHC